MPDLYLVRLHSDRCSSREKGQRFLNCKCPLGLDGQLNGQRFRKALGTRSLEKAYRKLAHYEKPDHQEPQKLDAAIAAFYLFKSDVGHGTRRNQRRALDRFLLVAKTKGFTCVPDIQVDTIDFFRSKREISPLTWTKELAILRSFFSFCESRRWIDFNPAKLVRSPQVKPKPKEPFTEQEVTEILASCEKLGRDSYERLRARAIVLLLRYTGLRISDVATLRRDKVRDQRIHLYTLKNGKPVFLPIPDLVEKALRSLPDPKGTNRESKYFFWSGNGTTRALIRSVTRTMTRVFEISAVPGAHAHRFRHTLATALLEKGWTTEDVAIVLGSTPTIIHKHYAQWSIQRQERIASLVQDVWSVRFLSGSQNRL